MSQFVKVAAVHAAPVFLDRTATTAKAISITREAARAGAQLIAFPETFIPAFPVWAALWAPIENHDLFILMADQSVSAKGAEIASLRREARALSVCISIGISESSPASVGAIWNSNILIGHDGAILNHHRKLVPTFYEKLIWASGDGAGLKVVDTPVGRVGNLICGENTNPLARYSLMAQAEQVHISSWPPIWPTRRPGNGANFNNVAANRIRSSAHSFEARPLASTPLASWTLRCANFLSPAIPKSPISSIGLNERRASSLIQRARVSETPFKITKGLRTRNLI